MIVCHLHYLVQRDRVSSTLLGLLIFETSLSLPTAQKIKRHDCCTILSFLRMKLRTALDRDWLQSLPTLHKVYYTFNCFQSCSFLTKKFLLSVCGSFECSLDEASVISEELSNHWDRV